MRKYVILAVMALASMVMASSASAADIQTLDAKIAPTKLDKKKFKPVKMTIDIRTGNNTNASNNADQPPTAVRTDVSFPKNLKFDTKAVPRCKVTDEDIANQTTDTAKQMCGPKSVVSIKGTQAEQTIDTNPLVADGSNVKVPVTVTAFNGKKPNTIYLHADPGAIPTKPVLTGKLVKGKGKFGNVLKVSIPNLGAGGISQFKTVVKAGKYIQGRCKTTKNPFQSVTTFTDWADGTKDVSNDSTKCKPKGGKKKRK
jgi:hypothetical protein